VQLGFDHRVHFTSVHLDHRALLEPRRRLLILKPLRGSRSFEHPSQKRGDRTHPVPQNCSASPKYFLAILRKGERVYCAEGLHVVMTMLMLLLLLTTSCLCVEHHEAGAKP
jgi:hypothetical protein